ncbi:NAD(P)-binding protein [Xylariaceae sp. FL1651]|nr:NAD(P)-binding protein [Xylariaceae sp. FL1651]
MGIIRGAITQFFPPAPHFTEAQTPSLTGKVFIVTGGNSGVGYELVKILYSKGGKVYVAGRSATKIATAIETIKAETAGSTEGQLHSLVFDLSDLSTIAPSVSGFLAKESRLDVLFNNAGITRQPPGSVTAQGHEMHMGTNCLGHHLLTKLLIPILVQTAKSAPKDTVRIVFTSSGIIDLLGPPGGVAFDELEPGKHSDDMNYKYSASKAGNWFLAAEFDRRYAKDGVVAVAQSPGTLRTPAWDDTPWISRVIMAPIFKPPKMGAYTELWSGLSADVKSGDGQKFIIPWGRFYTMSKKEHLASLKSKEEGGTGLAAEFFDYCDAKTKEFAT